MSSSKTEAHIDVVVCEPEKKRLFHSFMVVLDVDWPYVKKATAATGVWVCKTCKGRVYQQPRLVPQDIKAAAKQLGVRVKIRMFRDGEKCKDKHGVSHYCVVT